MAEEEIATCSFCEGPVVAVANIVDNGQIATVFFCEKHKLNYAAPTPVVQFVLNETFREEQQQEHIDDMIDLAFEGT